MHILDKVAYRMNTELIALYEILYRGRMYQGRPKEADKYWAKIEALTEKNAQLEARVKHSPLEAA